MPNNTQDAGIQKLQVVKCFSSSGAYIDTIRDAPLLTGFTEAVNAATTALKVTLPRSIDSFDGVGQLGSRGTLTQGNTWQWWLYGPSLPTSGLLRYQGYVEDIEPKIGEDGGESVDVTIVPFSQAVGDHAILGPLVYGTSGDVASYVDTGTMFSSFFDGRTVDPVTLQLYGFPLTLDPTNPSRTGNLAQYAFQNQKLSDALELIRIMSPRNTFYRPNPNNTMTFNIYPLAAPTHRLFLGQHIVSMSYTIANSPRKNYIIVQGNGVSANASGTSIGDIGQRSLIKNDSRITDKNTAQLVANGLLEIYDQAQIRTKVKIPDFRGDTQRGLGYDIETLRPGQSMQISVGKAPKTSVDATGALWDSFVWDRDKWSGTTSLSLWDQMTWDQDAWGTTVGDVFHAIVPIVALSYSYHFVELELGWRAPSLSRSLYSLEQKFSDYSLLS